MSSVAASRVSTSARLCGITAAFRMSAPSSSCIRRRRRTISSFSGVASKSWKLAITGMWRLCAYSISSAARPDLWKASISMRSMFLLSHSALTSWAYPSSLMGQEPPSSTVRKVAMSATGMTVRRPASDCRIYGRSGIRPSGVSTTASSNISSRHSASSTGRSASEVAVSITPSMLGAVMGAMMQGRPSPISTYPMRTVCMAVSFCDIPCCPRSLPLCQAGKGSFGH